MRYVIAVLALVGLGLAGPATAQQSGRNTSLAVKGILLMPGEAYVEEAEAFIDISMSFGVGGAVDTRLGDKLLGGVFLDLLHVTIPDDAAMMVETGVALKAVLGGGGSRPTWRPGFGLGYAKLGGIGLIESSSYFTVRGSVEMLLPSGWLAEAVVYGAPSGGNAEVTVTYGPMFQLRVGRVF